MNRLILAVVALIVAGCATTQPQRQADNIDLPFVDDPQLVGKWQSVDFVKTPDQFKAGQKNWQGELRLQELIFLAKGRTTKPWWMWTKGALIHSGDSTASTYTITKLGNALFMVLEWKSGDYTIRGMKPSYYILKKVQ